MMTWIICMTVLFVILFIIIAKESDGADAFFILLILYGLIGIVPSFVFEYSEDSYLINSNSISFIVNDLPHSRIITITAEGNDSLKLLTPDMGLPKTFVYDKIAEVARIDSLDFKFQHTKRFNIWGLTLYNDIDLVLGTK